MTRLVSGEPQAFEPADKALRPQTLAEFVGQQQAKSNLTVFIDEIHRLAANVEEILYPAMEDHVLDLVIGEGPSARSIRIDLAPFTLVAATTRAGLLATPLRDRFGIPLRLEFYTPAELKQVLSQAARKMGVELSPDGAEEIAHRARGTPRVAGRLLRRVRDFATADGTAVIGKQAAADRLGEEATVQALIKAGLQELGR